MLQSQKFDATALVNEFNNMSMGDLDKSVRPLPAQASGYNQANNARVTEYMT